MTYNVFAIPEFKKALKKLIKKYPSLKQEFINLGYSLQNNPTQGTKLSKNCYKIRLAIASKGKGKSGGARVITHFVVFNSTVYLLDIYDKSEVSTITDKHIEKLLQKIIE